MTFAPLQKSERAAFRQMLQTPDNARMGASVLMFLLSSLAVPFSEIEGVALLFLAYAAIFYYTLTHSVPSVLLVALPGALLFGVSSFIPLLSSPFTLPAAYAALVLGGMGGAFVLLHNRTPRRALPLLLLPVAVCLTVWLITRNPFQVYLALLPAILGGVLAFCILTCRAHTPSVLLLATVAGGLAVGGWMIFLAVHGFPDGNVLIALVESVRACILHFYTEALALYAEQGLSFGYSSLDMQNIAALLGNILPGLFGASCLLLAYILYRAMLRLMHAWGTLPRIPVRLASLTVSPMAAGVFTISYLVSLFAGATLIGTVGENLAILFEPVLVLVGVSVLMGKGAERSCLSHVLLLAVFIALFLNPAVALGVTALVGAFHILAARFLPHDKGGK